jgi:hypothetical protein
MHVDAINIFGVSAGTLASFRVVPRRSASFRVVSHREIQRFLSSRPFLRLVRFPAAPQRESWSESQALASFLFHQHFVNSGRLSSHRGISSAS